MKIGILFGQVFMTLSGEPLLKRRLNVLIYFDIHGVAMRLSTDDDIISQDAVGEVA